MPVSAKGELSASDFQGLEPLAHREALSAQDGMAVLSRAFLSLISSASNTEPLVFSPIPTHPCPSFGLLLLSELPLDLG